MYSATWQTLLGSLNAQPARHFPGHLGPHNLVVQSADCVRAHTRPPLPRQLSGSGPGHQNDLPTVSGCSCLLLPLATFLPLDRTVHSVVAQDINSFRVLPSLTLPHSPGSGQGTHSHKPKGVCCVRVSLSLVLLVGSWPRHTLRYV